MNGRRPHSICGPRELKQPRRYCSKPVRFGTEILPRAEVVNSFAVGRYVTRHVDEELIG
jgi:hypothetical protein